MKGPRDTTSSRDQEGIDRRTLWLLLILIILTFSIHLTVNFLFLKEDLYGFVASMMFWSIVIFSIIGVYALKYHHKRGIIPTKTVLKVFAKISFGTAVPPTIVLVFFIYSQIPDNLALLVAFVTIYLGMVLAIFLVLLIFMLMGFGLAGILSALERRFLPEALVRVEEITANTTDSSKKKGRMMKLVYAGVQWLFGIPDVLDTKGLTITSGTSRKRFPFQPFKTAVLWEMAFCGVLAIYISLNPLLLGDAQFQDLFSLATSLSFFIPLFIIPWFIFLRLNARIKGPVKDFKLYKGLRSRMVQTLVALGTLVVFIRLAILRPDILDVLYSFASFLFFFAITIIVLTFVYFNYFEEDLARDIAESYAGMRQD